MFPPQPMMSSPANDAAQRIAKVRKLGIVIAPKARDRSNTVMAAAPEWRRPAVQPHQTPLTNGIHHTIRPFMNTNVTLDGAGRIVIPKDLRDQLRLAPGDTLSVESDGERVTLRPVRSESAMRKEHG